MRRLLVALSLAAITLTTTACATVKGAGKDIQSVGQAGEDAIN
ncbi:entericidin A/B family lipoprotein [Porphyrobacter algicida]|uniref:Entericidin A/B family lipoprotein n=1 Tax=Qipengyuania algicida TaxID=1836209 RepID=A0A845ADI1_9SPHN|nr:entericidin A/B family lipoprotein [Qipengyuania algicida]MXP27293.1 entericidin A/B family lipoprotein [Qipengyuania algicida]